jgi:hypothetical protein
MGAGYGGGGRHGDTKVAKAEKPTTNETKRKKAKQNKTEKKKKFRPGKE